MSSRGIAQAPSSPLRVAPARLPHVSVCVCTFRRPDLLERLLDGLAGQRLQGVCTFSVVVADNDEAASGRAVTLAFARRTGIATTYCTEPRRNIALARNRAVAAASGDFIAFIDDDECPVPDWLPLLVTCCKTRRATGVLGPVRPHFDQPPPRWVVKGRFCERPEYPTGTVVPWSKSRTGNVLFRREILDGIDEPFRPQFGAGGEDVDFFQRLTARGAVFVWCNEAAAYEVVPPSRWTRSYMLRRALLRGRNNLQIQHGRTKALVKALVAVPAYTLVLPGALVLGQHVFMHVSIRCCDHLGRVLALVGLNPVNERPA